MSAERNQLDTAVLLITYRRLETTRKVFEQIRKVKPKKLYISSNMGRTQEEIDQVIAVRTYLEDNIDWECQLNKLFRAEYLSAKYSISGAIDWFFDNEPMGIILEDDCLPNLSFFGFCDQLLNKYEHDIRVGQITGNNFQNGIQRGSGDYYFSIHSHIWGWATWKDRWENYDVLLDNIDGVSFLRDCFSDIKERKVWEDLFYRMKKNPIDTWDYQWSFCLLNNKMLTVTPNVNLVKNIGFGSGATHTKVETEFSNLEAHDIVVKKYPIEVVQDYAADEYLFKKTRPPNIFIRIFNKIYRKLI